MGKILMEDFFARPVLDVAPDLLGKYLVRKRGAKAIAHMITEVEAYDGEGDLACHASRGRTPRTEVLYAEPGTLYVYFCYGAHWMLNVVTNGPEYPAAVLIRGVQEISGPGRVTKRLGISKSFNGTKASRASGLWFEDRGVGVKKSEVQKTPRIGISAARGVWARKPYRFVLASAARERDYRSRAG